VVAQVSGLVICPAGRTAGFDQLIDSCRSRHVASFYQLIERREMNVKRARPGARAEERRERLVVAAYEVMREHGIAMLRTRDVAAQAGITVATLHYYFPTKDALVRAVIEYAITDRMVMPLDLDETDGRQALRTMLEGLAKHAENDPGHFRLLHELIWRSHEDEAVRDLLRRWHTGWRDAIAAWLGDKRFRRDLAPEQTASIVVHAVLGMVTRPPGITTDLSGELDRLLTRS
jgi:TetR/AcrR family transcriptional regulator, regulator of cefoperazone and chloramphenicol sensitivity